MLHAVIMAGGAGERFWPLSRREKPKQFLNLLGERSMFQYTVDRLGGLVRPENVLVITGALYVDIVYQQVQEIPSENIIAEPCGRDTAAAVALATFYIHRRDPQGVMVVLPADHYIADVNRFQAILRTGIKVAADGFWLVTLGIIPTRPETGYGYIRRGELFADIGGVPVYRALGFIEKPDREKAGQYLASGGYFWNSGVFIWRVDLIRKLLAEHLPELFFRLESIEGALGTDEERKIINEIYPHLPKISIDYGVMEKAQEVLVLPGDFGWDDIGSWPALERFQEAEENGNIIEAKGVFLETRGSIIRVPDKVVATLGLEDMLIVDDGECLLICPKSKAQEIKKLISALREAGLEHVL